MLDALPSVVKDALFQLEWNISNEEADANRQAVAMLRDYMLSRSAYVRELEDAIEMYRLVTDTQSALLASKTEFPAARENGLAVSRGETYISRHENPEKC